ncbi:MAG: phosphatidate cytidylyltransferase [Nitrosospira sp. 56-18]|jgi:phosphatidate cytidylyltransferase|nr:phosphatidate cytidylyltransferase [Nitrosospira sp.]OJY07277.1 MAG: phosphatidate cytidylyltransferase [Nitrosospira sp. 56-18]
MVKTRILTAVVMLLLFLAALFYLSPIFWMALLLALTVAGAWEWRRLGGFSAAHSAIYLILTAILAGELLFWLDRSILADPYTLSFSWLYAVSAVFWIFYVPLFLKARHPIRNPLLMALAGWIVLLPTCLALFQLRAIDPALLLGFMAAIWISDTSAYFTGRSLGKHKLAPQISPGKTWEGAAGALAAVAIYALSWSWAAEEWFLARWLLPLLLVLAALGIVGDLFESLLKRHAGVKDSGNILPGHGGILDRIDALTSTLPLAILSLLYLQSES